MEVNDNIDKEIKLLKEQLNSIENKKIKNKNINIEDILYRLIYLNKKINNENEEKNYIELCLNKKIFLSEDIWLDYINIRKKDKNISSEEIINIYLKSLESFNYIKIIDNLFDYLLNTCISSKKYEKYFNQYLSKSIYSPEYSLKTFDLYYKFYKNIFKENNKDENFKEYIKKKLKKNCNLSEYEIEQILNEYKIYKKDKTKNKIFFIFEKKDMKSEQEEEEGEGEGEDEEEENIIQDKENDEIKNNIYLKIIDFNNQFNLLFNESLENSKLLINYLEENFDLIYKINKKYLIYYYDKILSKYIDNSYLWKNYLSLLDNITDININKLNILKTACTCCKKEGIFIVDYLYELEKSNFYDIEKTILEYINNPIYITKIEDIYIFYLQYKIRHFNGAEEEIKNIRNIFQKCLSNIENYDINVFTAKILHMWTEFEVYKTKDKEMFFNLMKKICLTLDKSINSFRAFIYFAKSFQNNEIQIREVYKLAYENLINEEKNMIENNWLQWEYLFGDINSISQLKQLIKDNNYLNMNISNNNDNINNNNDIDDEKEHKKVFIKGINQDVKENELKDYIKKKCPLIEYKDLRLVLDDNGKNRGYAFIDFNSSKVAKQFIDDINNNNNNEIKLKDSELICAFCLSPKSGKNDKRTLFVNNLPFDINKEQIKNTFKNYGNILDIRIIYNPSTQKPRGYGYIEFEDESSIDKIINSDKNFIINERKIIVSKSISVEKLRNAVKYVIHISNLNFKVKEKDIENLLKKEIYEDNDINLNDEIRKILLCKDDEGKFKGYGFIEFNNKESFDKCLKLDGKIFKGRNLVVKESTRNITEKSETNKKKYYNIDNSENKKFINNKRNKEKNKDEDNPIKSENEKQKDKNKKKKMNNSDFQKLFS